MTRGAPHGPSPQGPTTITVAGVRLPVELLLVILAFAGCGLWVSIDVLRVLPDVADSFDFSPRFGLAVLILLLMVLGLGLGLIAISWMLFRADRVGRGLAYVTAGIVVLSVLFAEVRTGAQTGAAVGSSIAAVILAFSPGVRDFFTGPGARHRDEVTSMVVVRVMLLVVAALCAPASVVYFLIGDVDSSFVAAGVVLLLVAAGAWFAHQRFAQPDRATRVVTSAAAALILVLILALGQRDLGLLLPVAITTLIPGLLWLAPDARKFFGDPPLDFSAQPATFGSAPQSPSAPTPPATSTPINEPSVAKETATGAPACTACGASRAETDAFCGACGTPVAATAAPGCASCGTTLNDADRFCTGCGMSVAGATS
jgi:Double zinc ribbon